MDHFKLEIVNEMRNLPFCGLINILFFTEHKFPFTKRNWSSYIDVTKPRIFVNVGDLCELK